MAAYDAVIVGAGPAGSAAAAGLARTGRRVLLLDRERFPRDKACGGGLTPRGVAALDRLGIDTHAPFFAQVSGLRMAAGSRGASVGFPSTSRFEPRGVVARRSDLDQALLDLACKSGAEFRDGVRVLGPVVEDGTCRGVRLHDRTEVPAGITIAADGATSATGRGAGLASSSSSGDGFWYTALRGYYGPVPSMGVLEFYPLRAGGRWLPAYGWVFPLSDGTANVGVDIPHRPRLRGCPPLRVLFDGFVEQLRRQRPGFAGARPESRPQGALLPEGMSGVRPSAPGLLLTGDAAGLVSPYSGEGIVYALESAELACQAIATGTSPTSIASGYTRALEEAYDFQFRGALAFMKGVRRRSLARLAAALGISHPRVLRAAVRVMAFLIEEDPSAPPSTISRLYLAAKRVLG